MSQPYDKPTYLSDDDRVGDDDDYLDSMSADSFPASDPPSTTPATVGSPIRAKHGRPGQARAAGQAASDVTLWRDVGSIARSLVVIGQARVRRLLGRGAGG